MGTRRRFPRGRAAAVTHHYWRMNMHCGQQAADVPVTDWFERTAVGASLLCLIHCAGLPLLLAALPTLSRIIALPDYFHVWVLGFAVPTSGVALIVGIGRHHAWQPLAAGSVGIALLSVGALLLLGGSRDASDAHGKPLSGLRARCQLAATPPSLPPCLRSDGARAFCARPSFTCLRMRTGLLERFSTDLNRWGIPLEAKI